MKIELDLLAAHEHPDVACAILVALMSVLPTSDVRLAIGEWRAFCKVRDEADDDVPFELPAVEAAEVVVVEVPLPAPPAKRTPGRPRKVVSTEAAQVPATEAPPVKTTPAALDAAIAAGAALVAADLADETKPTEVKVGNGAGDDPLAKLDLRELCRHAEREVGRDKVVEILRKHGVSKLVGVDGPLAAALRADVLELLS